MRASRVRPWKGDYWSNWVFSSSAASASCSESGSPIGNGPRWSRLKVKSCGFRWFRLSPLFSFEFVESCFDPL